MFDVFDDMIQDLYKQARISSTNAITGQTQVKLAINKALIDIGHKFKWPFRQHTLIFQTVAPYATGTITVSASSFSVSGSGTSWNTGWTGYWLQIEGEAEWYRVRAISSTTALILDQPYNGPNAGSGKSYKLIKRIYTLPSVVDDPADDWFIPTLQRTLEYKSKPAFDRLYANHVPGTPINFTRWSNDYITRTYSTGTVTGTSGTPTLTGNSTSWLGNVFEGDELEISGTKYTVLTVDSDTQITLAQILQTSPSTTAYTARSRNAINVELGFIPDDEYNIEIPCHKRLYKLIDNNDIFSVPSKFLEVVRLKALYELQKIHEASLALATKEDYKEALSDCLTAYGIGIESVPTIERD